MNISYKLNENDCDLTLKSPRRLAALAATNQLDSGADEAFDRLTFLASKLLNVPLTIVSFVGEEKQYFKSFHGLPEPWATQREVPIDVSVCQHTLVGDILSLSDARDSPILANNPAIPALNLVGYLGILLIDENNNNLGAFCAISNERREWSEADIETLKVLTKSIMSEIELKKKVVHLEKEREDWENTVALLTHDIRSPLATAYSFSETAMELNDPKFTSEALQSIQRTVGSTLTLVDRLLDWKKSSLDIHEDDFSYFELALALKSMIKDYETSDQATFNLALPDQELKLFGHEENVLRAIRNLISNAVKYGDPSREINVRIDHSSEALNVSVHNYGSPIPQDQIGNIFKIGKRASACATEQSWGFGLAQVVSTVQSHKGEVSVSSDPERGTQFTLSFPHSPN